MSLNGIDWQTILPRTQEAGRIQEQFGQQSLLAAEHAGRAARKEEKHKQTAVVSKEKSGKAQLTLKGRPGQEITLHSTKNKEAEEADGHPYKGTSIDYSG